MDDMKSAVYTVEELNEVKRPRLNELARKINVGDLRGTNKALVERMILRTKTVRCTWDGAGDLIAPPDEVTTPTMVEEVKAPTEAPKATVAKVNTKRIHPVLGEWNKYIIEAREVELKDETFANNHFAARIQMGVEVMLPDAFANFVATSCYSIEHYYDETRMDPTTGKMGLHTKRNIPDFFVRRVA